MQLPNKSANESNIRIALDSRLIKEGEYFVPVKGETTDGHLYIDKAFENGAKGVLEENELYDLVREKLERVRPKIVGVTGSSGKSTVTSFIATLLSSKYKVCIGNLNTKLGLSVNVMNDMSADCDVFVAEIGMDRPGEIDETTKLFNPDISVITTINETHMEKFGNLENIARAKFEILNNLKETGPAILNSDVEIIRKYAKKYAGSIRIVWFGLSETAELNPKNTDLSGLKTLGEHNRTNALASIAVAKELGVPEDVIIKQLSKLDLPKGRLTLIKGVNGSTLIDDTYNASPVSTISALKTLKDYPGNRKIAVLGDMLELGDHEKEGHEKVADKVNEIRPDLLITVGNLGKIIYEKVRVEKLWLASSRDFSKDRIDIKENDVILIKGSQGARMERITEALMKEPEKAKDMLVRQDARWK